jgi:hypothetical protein
MRGDSGFVTDEIARLQATQAQEDLCVKFPAVLVAGHLLHVFQEGDDWSVWINTEDMEFTGLCVGVGATREDAALQAIVVLEAIIDKLR